MCEVKIVCNELQTNITIRLKGRTNVDKRYTCERYGPNETYNV